MSEPNEAEDAEREKLVTPSENIDPSIVEWYALNGQYREFAKGSGVIGGYYFAQSDMRDLQSFVQAQKQKWVEEVESKLDATIDKFSIHTPKGIAKGTLARKSLKKQVRAALRGERNG